MKHQLSPEEIQYKLNTKDTTAELSLFYNIALDRINGLISLYENKTVTIENLNLDSPDPLFKDETYLHLKVFLWKEEISKRYAQINKKDRELINTVLKKLVDLRNFQSHYYHNAKALLFPKELIEHITMQFEKAKNQLVAKNPNFEPYMKILENDVNEFEKDGVTGTDIYRHFDFFKKNGFMLEEGKNFFLSFFLLKGEMAKFLKKRKRCKRDNGGRYQVKAKLLTFYCHRDNSNRFFLAGKKDYYDDNELLRRQFNTILNYLKTKPVADREYLPLTKEIELYSKSEMEEIKEKRKENIQPENKEEKEVIRRSNKFIDISIRYFMDRKKLGHADTIPINWAVNKFTYEDVEKGAAAQIINKDKKKYMKVVTEWQSSFVPGCFPIIKNNHAKFKIGNDTLEYVINEREIKNWLFYLLSYPKKSLDETLQKIHEYGKQYKQAMKELTEKSSITFQNYPLVFGKDGSDKSILSEAHYKILEQKKFDKGIYIEKIKSRINTTINFLKSELEQKDNYSRNRKNRVILKCFNWYLPLDAKLKPDEVNMLSIYNFVSENPMNPETRKSIIKLIQHKLSKASDGAFNLIQSVNNLNELYDAMIKKKIASLEIELKNIGTKSLDELHRLASKLSVTIPGIDVSKSGKPRLDELKNTINKNPVLIPNGFFKNVFAANATLNISTLINKNKKWGSLLIEKNYQLQSQDEFINGKGEGKFKKDISSDILKSVEDNYAAVFAEYSKKQGQRFEDFVSLFMKTLNLNEEKRKELIKALNLYKTLNEIKVKDSLLTQLLFEYHNLNLPLEDREKSHVNIATLFENEYELKIGDQKTIKLKYKQLDDLATNWNRGKIAKLFGNKEYWNDTLLKELDKLGKKSDQQKILILMNKVFEDSFYYIMTFLDVEKKVLEEFRKNCLQQFLQESKKLNEKGMERIEPEVLLKKVKKITGEQIRKFVKMRGKAFHTDIPEGNMKYEKEKDELAAIAGIQKKEKPDKKKYVKAILDESKMK